ncbi:MAG: hypothetical protein ACXWZW_08360 [Solirubrobacterales bacterium]
MIKKKNRRRLATVLATMGAIAAMVVPALASSRDGNDDSIPDRWEQRHGLSLKVDQAKRDQDRDGLKNKGEYRHKTDPRDADTDDDGFKDGDDDAPGHDVGDDGPNHDVGDDHGDDGPNHT